eukprot:Opistho-2@7774
MEAITQGARMFTVPMDAEATAAGALGAPAGNLFSVAVVGFLLYTLYRTCIAPSVGSATRGWGGGSGYGGSGYPGGGGGGGYPPGSGGYPGTGYGDSCGPSGVPPAPAPGVGGFWTGAATGGLLGYLMGNRGNYGGGYGYQAPAYGGGYRTYGAPTYGGG